MKTIIVFAAVLAIAAAGVLPGNEIHVVNENLHNNIGLGDYQYNYELSDGTKHQESAQLVPARSADEEASLRVTGSFSFVAADGQTYTVNYVADETGFHPEGAHLPVAPVA